MHVKRRRLPNFETCSVALFASLALYGPLPVKAQAAARSTPSVTSSAALTGSAIPPNRWSPEQLSQAFKQADANGDGKISRQEASGSAGLARHFDRIDTSKDGSISSAEFDEALK